MYKISLMPLSEVWISLNRFPWTDNCSNGTVCRFIPNFTQICGGKKNNSENAGRFTPLSKSMTDSEPVLPLVTPAVLAPPPPPTPQYKRQRLHSSEQERCSHLARHTRPGINSAHPCLAVVLRPCSKQRATGRYRQTHESSSRCYPSGFKKVPVQAGTPV